MRDARYYEVLDTIRRLTDSRWVALAWAAGDGSQRRYVRGREDMLPQARERFFAQIEACLVPDGVDPDPWERFQAAWRIRHGILQSFVLESGARGFYAVFCDREHQTPDPLHGLSEWVELVLVTMAAAASESERTELGWTRRQAVLESAAALLSASSEAELLDCGLGLAKRLLEADAAAYYAHRAPADAYVPVHVEATGTLKPYLETGLPVTGAEREALLNLGVAVTTKIRAKAGTTVGETCDLEILAVPDRDRDAVTGVICVLRTRPVAFTDLDRGTLVLYARQLGAALERQRLLTRLKRSNQELSQVQAQLVETARLQALGEVAARVAHDFNNVLGGLLGRVQLLQHAVPDPAVQTALSKMEHMIGAGEETVSRLQEAARLRTGTGREIRTLVALVRDVYVESEPALRSQAQIQDRKIAWHTEFLPTSSEIDRLHKLREPLRQLLAELALAAPSASKIELHTNRDGLSDRLLVAVVPPVAEATCDWQWDTLSSFANFRLAVGQLDGDCDASTGDGGKVEICVRLGDGTGRTRARQAARAKYRVLVVDDDPDVREVLEELLRVDGHTVTAAQDGAQALALFDPEGCDIVFTDLGMPGISGWQLAETVKQEAPHIPVVMVTGWGAQIDSAQLEASGVDRVLTKPFQWSAVLDTLNDLARPHTAPDAGPLR